MAEFHMDLGIGHDETILEAVFRTAQKRIAFETESMTTGGCKSMDAYNHSVGVIRAMNEILNVPDDIKKEAKE